MKSEWIPADNLVLEPNAFSTVISEDNKLVIAGPGAGKTELLAQRACYLLETNTCEYPQKILAISFKRDAAYNLKERVNKRCGESLSRRFDSMTFDAFAKMLLDQFHKGLPEGYGVKKDYDIIPETGRNTHNIIEEYRFENVTFVNTHQPKSINDFHVLPLPIQVTDENTKLKKKVWTNMLSYAPPRLSFRMIMRLSELVIKTNPILKNFLISTYSHVFLDEFQDATTLQYEFLNTCFKNSICIVTAVGDDKQRIMIWAGARKSIFDDFLRDYSANYLPLTCNYRSAPNLITLQNHLIEHLLGKSDFMSVPSTWKGADGEAFCWFYQSQEHECKHLFLKIKEWKQANNLAPRDICILVKQQLPIYAGHLIEYFNENGIKARDENRFQDILTEPVVSFIVNILVFICDNKRYTEKETALEFIINLNSLIEDKDVLSLERKFNQFVNKLIKEDNVIDPKDISETIDKIIDFTGKDKITASISNYANPTYLDKCIKDICEIVNEYLAKSSSLNEALSRVLGLDSIPVMTIHKSKGLEYHTVIFLGLEDGAFWSFNTQADEDKCAFFVALSRAKERVVFTFSKTRELRFGIGNQSIQNIRVIFDELQKSKIVKLEEISEL